MDDPDRPTPRVALAARGAYLLVLLLATLTNLRLELDPGRMAERAAGMLSPSLSARDAVDGLRNLTLFAGWGLVWLATAPVVRSMGAIRNAVLTGAAISLLVELVQLASTTRTPSLLDVGTNTGGALLGALTLLAAVMGMRRLRSARSFVGLPASAFALSYGSAVAAEALVPLFRQATPPNTWGGPMRRMGLVLASFEWSSLLELPLADLLLFAPAGVFAVAALAEVGHPFRRSATWVAAAGLLASVLAEVGHGFLGLHIQLGAAAVHGIGIAAGAVLAAQGLPWFTRTLRGRQRPRALALAYGILLLVWALRPWVPVESTAAIADQLATRWWMPLGAHRLRMDVFSVVDVVTGFMIYLPAGALLAVWPVRWRGPLSAFLPAIYVAALGEAGQLFVDARTVDVTDVLVDAAAAATGWLIARRAGLRPFGALLPRDPGAAVSPGRSPPRRRAGP